MRDINEVLDAVKARHGLTSDYKLAMFLGLGDANVRNYRHGRSLPDEKHCAKIAEALGEPPYVLIAEMQAHRARTTEARSLWEQLANQLRHAVAAVMFVVGAAMLVIAGSPTTAEASTGSAQTHSSPGLCIMLNRVRRVRRAVARGIKRLWQSLVHGMPEPDPANQSGLPEKDQRDKNRAPAFSRPTLAAGA